MKDVHLILYLRAFALRLIINVAAVFVLQGLMQRGLDELGTYNIHISRNFSFNKSAELFNTAAYAFNEATIVIALCGLLAVVLVALLAMMGTFIIISGEAPSAFRFRLFLYTLAHLLISLALTTYLVLSVATIVQTNSVRLNESTAFMWTYPTFAIVAIVYIAELYCFLSAYSAKQRGIMEQESRG